MLLALLLLLPAFAGVRPDPGPALIGQPAGAFPAADGRVWIPTDEGLARVDGQEVYVYGAEQGLTDPSTLSVFTDPRGETWVGTERGVAWVSGDHVVPVEGVPGPVFHFGDSPEGAAVVHVQGVSFLAMLEVSHGRPVVHELPLPPGVHSRGSTILPNGQFVVGTNDGLFEVHGDTLAQVEGTGGTKAGPFLLQGERLVFATGHGVARWDGQQLTRWLDDHYITGLVAHRGALYVGDSEGWLRRIDEDGTVHVLGRGPEQSLFSLVVAGDMVFGATWGGGLVRYDPATDTFEVLGPDQGMKSGVIQQLRVDREGSLWITTGGGVQVLTHFTMDHIGASELGANEVLTLREVEDQLLVGTGRGLAIPTHEGWRVLTRDHGLASSSVTEITPLSDGSVLLTGPGHAEGVTHLDLGSLQATPVTEPWGAADARWGVNVGALPPASWLVERHSHGELLEVNPEGQIVARDLLPEGGFVNSMSVHEGQAWLATTHGVYRWAHGLTQVSLALTDPGVAGLASSDVGPWLWYDRPLGLQRFPAEGTPVTIEGLPSPRVTWAWPTPEGTWVGTSRGVARVEADQVVEVLTLADGLPSLSTNDGLVDASGALWVATAEGLVRFAPWRHDPPRGTLDLRVHATLNGAPLQGAEADWAARELVAHLDARTYVDRDQLRFRWRLLPEGAWAPWGADRTLRMTGLDVGEHTLEVEAKAGDGRTASWSASFRVRPPWWRSVGFLLLLSAGLIGLGLALGWWRLRQVAADRKRLEDLVATRTAELQRMAEQLAAGSAAKSRYLADMSHELRTPLNAIIGYTELIAEEAREEGLDFLLEDTDRVEIAAHHLLALINDVLDLSKIEAGRLDFDLQVIPLDSLVREVCTALEPVVSKNGNALVFKSAPVTAQGDAHRVRQILTNLIGNAAKFTHEGRIVVSLIDEGDRGGIAVTDSGVGMSQAVLDKLFQPFAQASSQTAKQFGGTGLGLVISRELAQAMGGEVEVSSVEGEGSTFTLWLPRASAEQTG